MAEITYEKAIKRLEKIVDTLESGELSLDESIALFEEGTKLCKFCNDALNNAEQKIKSLEEAEKEKSNE